MREKEKQVLKLLLTHLSSLFSCLFTFLFCFSTYRHLDLQLLSLSLSLLHLPLILNLTPSVYHLCLPTYRVLLCLNPLTLLSSHFCKHFPCNFLLPFFHLNCYTTGNHSELKSTSKTRLTPQESMNNHPLAWFNFVHIVLIADSV